MTVFIKRRPLSAFLLGLFRSELDGGLLVPCGYAKAPSHVAWDNQPNKTDSNFRPYLVLTPSSSGPHTGPIDANSQDWQIPYGLSAFGIAPEQTELLADAARQVLKPLAKQVLELDDERYKIQQAKIDSIGLLQGVDSTDPPYWGQTDGFTLWLSKVRA